MRRRVELLMVAVLFGVVAGLLLPPLAAQAVDGTYTFRIVAGKADRSSGYHDGPAAEAQFVVPTHIVRAADGTIHISDPYVTSTRRLQSGVVSTTSSTVFGPMGVAPDGTLYVITETIVHRQLPGGSLQPYAGNVNQGYVDGAIAQAKFAALRGVAADTAGNVYLTEGFHGFQGGYCFPDQLGNMIRKISAAGEVTTLAGAACQLGSTDGPGATARFNSPTDIVVDGSGALFVVDAANFTIRRIAADGTVSTLAGTALQNGTTDGAGASARFSTPRSLTLASTGLYLLDGPNAAPLLRFVDFNGTVSTLATLPAINRLAVADAGFVVTYQSTIASMTAQGVLTTIAGQPRDPTAGPGAVDGPGAVARFRDLRGVVLDDRGGVYLTDAQNNTIRYFSASGVTSTFVGTAGIIGNADGTGPAARFNLPHAIARSADGTLYVADEYNDMARRISPAGVVTTLPVLSGSPVGVAVAGNGTVYVGDQSGPLQQLTSSGTSSVFLNTVSTQIHTEPAGTVIVTIPSASFPLPQRFRPDGTHVGAVAVAVQAVDRSGRLYGLTSDGTMVRRVDLDGTTHDFAVVRPPPTAANVFFSDMAVTDAGDIYWVRGVELWLGTLTAHAAPVVASVTAPTVLQGASAQITASVSGTPHPAVQWQLSGDGGATWTDVADGAAYSGARTATLTIGAATMAMNGHRFRVVATNLEGVVTSASATLTVNGIVASPSALRYVARRTCAGCTYSTTGGQPVTVTFTGGGSPTWTAAADKPWVRIDDGAGTGAGQFSVRIEELEMRTLTGTHTATVTIQAPSTGLTSTVAVTLEIDPALGFGAPPFGVVDTPLQDAGGVQGAFSMSGWVLDDLGVRLVRIYRNCAPFETSRPYCVTLSGLPHLGPVVEVGDATFVQGARPDVEALYPNYPMANRAGWGFMILSNMLPNVPASQNTGGVGAFTFHALAFTEFFAPVTPIGRAVGDQTGTRITATNDTIAKPFGAIDTPTQGQTVSGSLNNFGWALTPDPGTGVLIPTAGSTITVFIDGAAVGATQYNLCRGTVGNPVPAGVLCDDDVSTAFRGDGTRFRNLDAGRGPIGLRSLDTTTLTNGMHTISWGVTDSANRSEGIGSRYFTVLNGSADAAACSAECGVRRAEEVRSVPAEALAKAGAAIYARTGFDPLSAYTPLVADATGVPQVRIPELGRVELQIPGVTSGVMLVNGETRPLPVGVGINTERGIVTWAPGVGYLGTYRLQFGPTLVDVTVAPASTNNEPIRMHLDFARSAPRTPHFALEGWALDPQSASGAGIGAVHVWGKRIVHGPTGSTVQGSEPIFLGVADLHIPRPDVAAAHGAQYPNAGFRLVTTLPEGEWEVTAYVWVSRTGRFEDARTMTVTVR